VPLPDDIREFVPGKVFRDGDEKSYYWIRNGKVAFRHRSIRGADTASFRFYPGGFAKDLKYCYSNGRLLKGGNGASFRTLNYTYATDGRFVWTTTGPIKDVDVASFVVCDDGGFYYVRNHRSANGYGKDRFRVYYADAGGKGAWVRKASPESFVSLNDGLFGKDDQHVFHGVGSLPKANPKSWRRLGSFFSKDDERVYYGRTIVNQANCGSFEVLVTDLGVPYARDKNRYYRCTQVVDPDATRRELEQHFKKLWKIRSSAPEPTARFDQRWLTSAVIDLARSIRQELAFDRLGILGDALMDAGCDSPGILSRCQETQLQRLGCWVVDLILYESSRRG